MQLPLLSTETSKKILQGILLTSSGYPILQISNYQGIPTSSGYPILQFVSSSYPNSPYIQIYSKKGQILFTAFYPHFPRDVELCPCVNDVTANGVLNELTVNAKNLKYFSIDQR